MEQDKNSLIKRVETLEARIAKLEQDNKRLAADRRLFEAILSSLNNIIYVKDPLGHLRYVNRGFEILAGRPSADLLGHTDKEIFADNIEEIENILLNDAKVFDTKQPLSTEEMISINGKKRYYVSTKSLFYVDQDEPWLCGISTEITEQKELQQQLADSKQELIRKHAILEKHHEKLQAVKQQLQEGSEEIATQNEELRTANEELMEQQQKISQQNETLRLLTERQQEDNTRLRELNQKSARSLKKYRLLTENSLDLLILLDNSFKHLFISPASINFCGYTPDEIKQLKNEDFIHPADIASFNRKVKGAHQKKQVYSTFVYRMQHKAGHYFWVESKVKRHYTAEGQHRWSIINSRNVDDRIKAEESLKAKQLELQHKNEEIASQNAEFEAQNDALKESYLKISQINRDLENSRQRLRAVLATSPDLIMIFDERGTYLDIFTDHENLLYAPRQELVGKTVYEVLEKEQADVLIAKFRAALDTEMVQTFEYPLLIDNYQRWFSARISTVDYDNRICLVLSARDETSRKKVEEALQSSMRLYRQLVETIPYGIEEVDVNGIITFSNAAQHKMFGYKAGELIGQSVAVFYPPEEQARATYYLKSIIEEKHEPESFYETHQTKDGRKLEVKIDWDYRHNEAGELLGFIAVVSDVTAQRCYEADLIAAKEQAEEADRLKSVFLANMSHEIRTPMNGILGFADLLAEPELSHEKQQRFIEIIRSSANNLLTIINEIVDISKIEAGLMAVSTAPLFVRNLINDLTNFFIQHKKVQSGVLKLKSYITPDIHGLRIDSDASKLRQILTNLIENAVKFTDSGSVEFGVQLKDSDTLLFMVRDTGIGIPQGKLKTIFERFRQADESISKRYGGTGLGLSISIGLANLLGGSIEVESIEGEGTTFWFALPFKALSPRKSDSKAAKALPDTTPWRNRVVLIVEDDSINLDYLNATLEKTGLKILTAKRGMEAVDICLANKHIDLVLMDIRLPDISGYEVTRLIKNIMPELPIIAQTAFAMEEDKQRSRAAGCDAYIAKPFQRAELIALLKQFLG